MARSCASAKQGFRKVSHVLFDMDGLLLDTESIYTQATTNIVAQYGKTFDWTIKLELMGLLGEDSAKRIVELMELPITWEEYYAQAQQQYELLMPHAKLMPGAERLVKHLHKSSVPIAVATSSSKTSFDLKAQNHQDFFKLFHHVVTGGSDPDVKSGKPSPDIFLVCASRFPEKPSPESCLVFEDAPNGVTAANSAGMQSVMVPESYIPEDRTKHATLVLKSLSELKPELFGIPAFKDNKAN